MGLKWDSQVGETLKQSQRFKHRIHVTQTPFINLSHRLRMEAGTCINSLCMSNTRKEGKFGNKVKIMVPNLNIIKISALLFTTPSTTPTQEGENVEWIILNELMSSCWTRQHEWCISITEAVVLSSHFSAAGCHGTELPHQLFLASGLFGKP